MTRISLCDLSRQTSALRPELMAAIGRVVDAGHFILGDEVAAFEQDLAASFGEPRIRANSVVGVANGTDALWLALRALGVGAGDLVATTPFTFFATAGAIANVGARPLFVDIDRQTLNLDPLALETALAGRSRLCTRLGFRSDSVRAIIAVHLYGQPADMDDILKIAASARIPVIEDVAQAHGARWRNSPAGLLGRVGCFSFFPSKNLGAFGDGGMVLSIDDALASRVRSLRAHGATRKYLHQWLGTNSRLDALQAAILRVKLPHLPTWIAARRSIAARYEQALAGHPHVRTLTSDPRAFHAYHQFTVRVLGGRRDELAARLASAGVDTAVYYPTPLHLQEVFAPLGYRAGDLPVAEAAAREVLSLPIFPELLAEERDHVLGVINDLT